MRARRRPWLCLLRTARDYIIATTYINNTNIFTFYPVLTSPREASVIIREDVVGATAGPGLRSPIIEYVRVFSAVLPSYRTSTIPGYYHCTPTYR